jgi:hypothetical protein
MLEVIMLLLFIDFFQQHNLKEGIQDKIGESSKKFVRERERTGKCRCSTALEYNRMLSNNIPSFLNG